MNNEQQADRGAGVRGPDVMEPDAMPPEALASEAACADATGVDATCSEAAASPETVLREFASSVSELAEHVSDLSDVAASCIDAIEQLHGVHEALSGQIQRVAEATEAMLIEGQDMLGMHRALAGPERTLEHASFDAHDSLAQTMDGGWVGGTTERAKARSAHTVSTGEAGSIEKHKRDHAGNGHPALAQHMQAIEAQLGVLVEQAEEQVQAPFFDQLRLLKLNGSIALRRHMERAHGAFADSQPPGVEAKEGNEAVWTWARELLDAFGAVLEDMGDALAMASGAPLTQRKSKPERVAEVMGLVRGALLELGSMQRKLREDATGGESTGGRASSREGVRARGTLGAGRHREEQMRVQRIIALGEHLRMIQGYLRHSLDEQAGELQRVMGFAEEIRGTLLHVYRSQVTHADQATALARELDAGQGTDAGSHDAMAEAPGTDAGSAEGRAEGEPPVKHASLPMP